MGSARYFVGHELSEAAFNLAGSAPVDLHAAAGGLDLVRAVRFD
jgi:hypothetical protein